MSKTIFLSAGEISGDMHASALVKEMKKIDPSLNFAGTGGKYMASAGVKLITEENTIFSAIGLTDSIKFLKYHQRFFKSTLKYIKNNKIDAVILVDHQGINIPLSKFCKKLGIPTFYYFPPHVSIWGMWNAPKLAKNVKAFFTPFYEDYAVYKKYTKNVYYFGHPLTEVISSFKIDKIFYEKMQIKDNKKIIGIFPGSRYQEIENLILPMLKSVKLILKEFNADFILSISHPAYKAIIQNAIEKEKLEGIVKTVENESYSIMTISDLIIAASGTTTLEATLFEKPVIICYRISPLSFFIGKFLVKKKMIGMPNIILDEKVFPELLQDECNPQRILTEAKRFLEMNEDEKKKYHNYYKEIKKKLGSPPVIEKIANKIIEEIANG